MTYAKILEVTSPVIVLEWPRDEDYVLTLELMFAVVNKLMSRGERHEKGEGVPCAVFPGPLVLDELDLESALNQGDLMR